MPTIARTLRWMTVCAALAGCADDDAGAPTVDSATVATTTLANTTLATATSLATMPTATTQPSATSTPPVDTPATTADASTPVPTTTGVVPAGFAQVAATATAADGTLCELCLWLADDGDLRQQGLMFVTDLGGADGMVFRYPGATTGSFWMKNTVMPLSIAFFDADGRYIDDFDMEPCAADPCPSYPTPADFVDAVEVPLGALPELAIGPGSTLVVSDLPCHDG